VLPPDGRYKSGVLELIDWSDTTMQTLPLSAPIVSQLADLAVGSGGLEAAKQRVIAPLLEHSRIAVGYAECRSK